MKSLLYLANNIIRSNFSRMNYPFKLTFIVTNQCNLRCKMCNIWNKNGSEPELTTGEIERIFKRNNFFSWVNISGGEIFLRPDIVDIIKTVLATNKNLYLLDFPTNGFMTDTILQSVSRILKYRPERLMITVSLDGPLDLHNELRGHRESWQKVIETFTGLRKLGERNKNMQVYFGFTIMPQNMRTLNDAFLAVKSRIPYITHDDFHINIAHDSEHYYENKDQGFCAESEALEYLSDFVKHRKYSLHPTYVLERKYQKLSRDYFLNKKIPMACKALSSSCFLDPYGNIFPCSIYDKKIGNLKEYDFDIKKLWNSEMAIKVQKEVEHGNCPQCWTPCEAYQTLLGNLRSWW